MASYVFGVIMGLLSLLGLTLAARAHDAHIAIFGWGLCLFGIVVIMSLIHKATEPGHDH